MTVNLLIISNLGRHVVTYTLDTCYFEYATVVNRYTYIDACAERKDNIINVRYSIAAHDPTAVPALLFGTRKLFSGRNKKSL